MKENTNVVGNVLDLKTAVCREFNIPEIVTVIARSGLMRAGSWGFTNPMITVPNKAFRFTVTGMVFKGWVHIVLNGLDLFDIYYTNKKDVIKKVSNDVYIMDLIETLDVNIERTKKHLR